MIVVVVFVVVVTAVIVKILLLILLFRHRDGHCSESINLYTFCSYVAVFLQ